jgi:redox-sensing transcriptional repressor
MMNMKNRKVISRLSKYKNALHRFKALGFAKMFSDYLAESVGCTSSQVRKDFSMFGITGNKRGGYNIDELLEKLNIILGKNIVQQVIIAGAGNLGKALLHYKGFERDGIKVAACFDIDPSKQNAAQAIPILPMEELTPFVGINNIEVGILAVPDLVAQEVFDLMVKAGIKGVLNFAPIRLRTDGTCCVNNINLEMELESILYFVNVQGHAPAGGRP